MTVIQFPLHSAAHRWDRDEMNALLAACGESLEKGTVTGWEVGETENGDPQLYVIGPAPDYECILCISRLGRHYVVENGEGRILCEQDTFESLSDQIRHALRHKKAAIIARATMVWFALRETFEERIEPVFAEPAEALAHVAPQLVALI